MPSSSVSADDALAIQQVARALHAAAAEVEDAALANQLDEWADRIACQIAAALEGEDVNRQEG